MPGSLTSSPTIRTDSKMDPAIGNGDAGVIREAQVQTELAKGFRMNAFQEIFDRQKVYFDSDATKSYEWRIDQLTRLENLLKENSQALEDAVSSDFKTASQEKVFEIMAHLGTAAFTKAELKEWMKPVDVVIPKALAASGHTAKII